MLQILRDPLDEVLGQFRDTLVLGDDDRSLSNPREMDRLRQALASARTRNSRRFYVVLAVLGAAFAALVGTAAVYGQQVDSAILVGGTGVTTGGVGAILVGFVRTWWRADTLLTVAEFADAKTMNLIIRSLLKAEAT